MRKMLSPKSIKFHQIGSQIKNSYIIFNPIEDWSFPVTKYQQWSLFYGKTHEALRHSGHPKGAPH